MHDGSRLHGITSMVDEVVVGAIGASGGAPAYEKVGRTGMVKKWVVVDPGKVKAATMSRMAFDYQQIGQFKAEALKTVLERPFDIGCAPEIETYTCKVEDVPVDVFKGIDLIIAGTDDRHAQNYVSRLAKKLNIPFIAVGFHENIAGGHIQWCVPGDGNA